MTESYAALPSYNSLFAATITTNAVTITTNAETITVVAVTITTDTEAVAAFSSNSSIATASHNPLIPKAPGLHRSYDPK